MTHLHIPLLDDYYYVQCNFFTGCGRNFMIPIYQLLNRIHWDDDFAKADFVIGFFDRVSHEIVRLPLQEIYFEKSDHYFFHFLDKYGEEHGVPLHRIKEVTRNGELVWHREH